MKEYSLLVREKDLIPTVPTKIYQGENNTDSFKFIVPKEYATFVPTLQVILADGKSGKIKACQFEEEIYKDNYILINVPITSTLTQYSGYVQLWLTFFSDEGEEKTEKTEIASVYISEHKGFTEVTGDDGYEDIGQVVTQLQSEVKILSNSKADGIKISENNELILTSGSDEVSKITLPDDVTWEML